MSDVVKFEPSIVGDGLRLEPDQVIEAAKGQGFIDVLILGTLSDGTRWMSATCSIGESMLIMERAKHDLVDDN